MDYFCINFDFKNKDGITIAFIWIAEFGCTLILHMDSNPHLELTSVALLKVFSGVGVGEGCKGLSAELRSEFEKTDYTR